jgi:hypothetical protein
MAEDRIGIFTLISRVTREATSVSPGSTSGAERQPRQRRQRDRRRRDGVRDDLHDRARVRIRVGVVLRVEALADAAGRRREAVGAERDVGPADLLDAIDHHRVDLGVLDDRVALERAAQRAEDALGVALDADVVRDEVDRAALRGERQREGRGLAGELVLLQDLHPHPQHPVQRAIPAVRDPVAGALAEELAEHRLDRRDRGGLVNLAHVPDNALQPLRPVWAITVLAAVGVGDDTDFHRIGLVAIVRRDATRRKGAEPL